MPPCGVAIKQSKMPLRRRQGERQKAIGKQNNILARASRFFLNISLPSLHYRDRESA